MAQTGKTPLFVEFHVSSKMGFLETLSAINTFGFSSRSRLHPFLAGFGGGFRAEIHGSRSAKAMRTPRAAGKRTPDNHSPIQHVRECRGIRGKGRPA